MPSWPPSVRTSAKRNATSVIGRCRPVSTLASLIPVGSGNVTEESVTASIRSRTAGASVDRAVGTVMLFMSLLRGMTSGSGSADEAGALGVERPAGDEVLHGHGVIADAEPVFEVQLVRR